MDAKERQLLERLYRALPGEVPLEPDDPRYLPIYDDPELTASDPVEQLARTIEWSDRGTMQFLVGCHQCGKSTELRRLKRRLEAEGHLVGLVDARQLNATFDSPIPAWMAFLIARAAWTSCESKLTADFKDDQLKQLASSARLAVGFFSPDTEITSLAKLFDCLSAELGFGESRPFPGRFAILPDRERDHLQKARKTASRRFRATSPRAPAPTRC